MSTATKTPKPLFLRRGDVCTAVGFSAPTLHRLVARGEFPAPRKLGLRAVGWLASEVDKWAASRPVSDIMPAACIARGVR